MVLNRFWTLQTCDFSCETNKKSIKDLVKGVLFRTMQGYHWVFLSLEMKLTIFILFERQKSEQCFEKRFFK